MCSNHTSKIKEICIYDTEVEVNLHNKSLSFIQTRSVVLGVIFLFLTSIVAVAFICYFKYKNLEYRALEDLKSITNPKIYKLWLFSALHILTILWFSYDFLIFLWSLCWYISQCYKIQNKNNSHLRDEGFDYRSGCEGGYQLMDLCMIFQIVIDKSSRIFSHSVPKLKETSCIPFINSYSSILIDILLLD